MPISASRKKANQRWDSENMSTLGCKIRRNDALIFKEYAKSLGTTANTLLKSYVLECNHKFSKEHPEIVENIFKDEQG